MQAITSNRSGPDHATQPPGAFNDRRGRYPDPSVDDESRVVPVLPPAAPAIGRGGHLLNNARAMNATTRPIRTASPLAPALLMLAAAMLAGCQRAADEPPAMVGTEACATCHQQAFDDWQQSHHRHAMELPGPDTVLGDFRDARFEYFGTTSRFFTRDGQYYVETDNAAGRPETFRVAYTFGWYPLQQYLVEFPDGRLQALGITWDSRPAAEGGQRWYHLYPDDPVTHEDPLHWTGSFQNWNSRCASCHSTELVKGYDAATNRYQTRWKELNVGCEACHGPGSRHVQWARSGQPSGDKGLATQIGKAWQPQAGVRAIPDSPPGMSGQLQVCSACHSRRTELQQPDITAAFHDSYILSPPLAGLYHADGQIREEVYETGSFMQSPMHQNHVSCSNCHEPHSSRLRATGNALCLQCHEPPKYQTKAHFFHEPESAGAQCVNCHMPQQTYMGVDVRRDHSFRVPDPIASLRFGVPNACTQCHAGKDDRWAADAVTRHSGRTEPWYAHTALLHAARSGRAAALPGLLAYAGDDSKPAILRAAVLQESARFASPQLLEAIDGALASADPLVRTAAVAALREASIGQRAARLLPLMQDPVKAVRMSVARQLIELRTANAPPALQPQLETLFAEYEASLLHNADMPESMSDLALFRNAQGNLEGAIEALLKARQLAPKYLPAMLNLSDLYRARGRDDLGEPLLREAMAAYPESADARHMMGLLYVRTGRTPDSVALFRQASQMAPDNPHYAMVYAVALVETGRRPEGIAVLEAASRRFPDDPQIRQALQSFRAQQP